MTTQIHQYSVVDVTVNAVTIKLETPYLSHRELAWWQLRTAARHEDPQIAAVYVRLLAEARRLADERHLRPVRYQYPGSTDLVWAESPSALTLDAQACGRPRTAVQWITVDPDGVAP